MIERSNNSRRTILGCLLICALTVAVFWPAIRNDFVSYDDPDYVTENVHVLKGLSWENTAWAFTTGHAGNWHPLTWLSHMADVQLFGLKPGWHHLISLLLHTANAALLFLVLRWMTGVTWRSASVAALFALHPLHVESVAWVAERKDVLSTFFFLLTIGAYARYVECGVRSVECGMQHVKTRVHGPWSVVSSPAIWYGCSLVLFALGLMSKPMVVTLPFLLLLLDYWPLQRFQPATCNLQPATCGRLLLEKLPFLTLSAAASTVTFLVQQGAGAVSSLERLPLEFRISNALVSYVRYLGKTFWPTKLAVFYPLPKEWPIEWVLATTLFLAAITGLAVWRAKKAPYLPIGWFWFLGTLVPVIGLVQVGQQAMADRYSYIPLIGLFIMVVWTVSDLSEGREKPRRHRDHGAAEPQLNPVGTREMKSRPVGTASPITRGLLGIGGAGAIAACCILTWNQLAHWKNNATLFEHALAVTHDNPVAHNNLGTSLLNAGNIEAAESHFAEAVRIRPNYPEALLNLGLCREKQGQTVEAVGLLERGLAIQATPNGHYNLANALSAEGKLAEAESHYQAALQLKPKFIEAQYNLGILKAKQGKAEEAAEAYTAVLALNPGYLSARLSLGALLAGQKKFEEAIAQFQRILRTAPENADAEFNLAAALSAKGSFAEAALHYATACRLRPDDLEARTSLGLMLVYQGKMLEAAPEFEKVLQVRPTEAKAHYYLAIALHTQGQFEAALPHYREAARQAPQEPLYLNDLAWILATHAQTEVRNGKEAVRLAEEAIRLSGGKEARFWGTLDAAYAEAGRFEEAVATATKTRELASATGQKDLAQAAEARLTLYRAHQPYRPPALTGAQP